MSRNIYLISETSFKDYTIASQNIDTKFLGSIIKMIQDRYIHPICGSALYNKILDIIEDGTIKTNPANADYKTLVDEYLTDVLFNYVLSEIPMSLQFKYVNKGVLKRTSENSQQPDFSELTSVMAFYKGYGEWYAERAINYLIANPTLFPEYLNPGSDVTTIHPVSNQYRAAIYLGSGDYEDPRPYSERYQGNRYKKPF
jgi:hypothetical protein